MATESRTSNPAFRFADYDAEGTVERSQGVTATGVMIWSFIYIAIMCLTGAWAWEQTYAYARVEGTAITELPQQIWGYAIGALLVGFVISLFTIFIPRICMYTAPFYSACEGVVLGCISAAFESAYPGIILNTVVSTVGVFAVIAFLYGTGIVRVNETFKLVLLSAMSAILLVYVADILISIFAGYRMPFLHEQGNIWAICFSIGVVIVAGLNFAWDFDNVRVAQEEGAPKYYEAYLAFGFMLTLVWLYIEILRLWALLQGKKD